MCDNNVILVLLLFQSAVKFFIQKYFSSALIIFLFEIAIKWMKKVQ